MLLNSKSLKWTYLENALILSSHGPSHSNHQSKHSTSCHQTYKKVFYKLRNPSTYYNKVLLSTVLQFSNLAPAFAETWIETTTTFSLSKSTQINLNLMQSFENVHLICKRATTNKMMKYKRSIVLHKFYNNQIPIMDWIQLNFHQTLSSRAQGNIF